MDTLRSLPRQPATAQPAARAAAQEDNDDADGQGEAEKTIDIFSEYQCRSNIPHARPHPGDIAEPASLAAIPLPLLTYTTAAFPPEVVTLSKLSALQLEGVLHACSKHCTYLPSGERERSSGPRCSGPAARSEEVCSQ